MKVKCLSCVNLEVCHDPDGLLGRCSKGFFDKRGVPQYFAISGLVRGNVALWRAEESCNSYSRMKVQMRGV